MVRRAFSQWFHPPAIRQVRGIYLLYPECREAEGLHHAMSEINSWSDNFMSMGAVTPP
jgi:hypothetical protein